MSSRGSKRGLRRGSIIHLPAEVPKAKRNRTSKVHQAAVASDSGLEMLGNRLDDIVGRLVTLERERERASETTFSTDSTNSALSDLQVNPLSPQTVGLVETSVEAVQSVVSGSSPEITYIMRPAVDKPIFHGKNDSNPMKFIQKLKRYINSINGQNRAVDIATECLAGSALKLLEIFSDKWSSLADFERDFKIVFWSNSQQEKAKYRLINSSWNSKSQITMSEHFSEQIDMVRLLTIPLSESDMVNSIMRHFSVETQRLWFTRKGANSILIAAEFLRDVEQNIVVRTN